MIDHDGFVARAISLFPTLTESDCSNAFQEIVKAGEETTPAFDFRMFRKFIYTHGDDAPEGADDESLLLRELVARNVQELGKEIGPLELQGINWFASKIKDVERLHRAQERAIALAENVPESDLKKRENNAAIYKFRILTYHKIIGREMTIANDSLREYVDVLKGREGDLSESREANDLRIASLVVKTQKLQDELASQQQENQALKSVLEVTKLNVVQFNDRIESYEKERIKNQDVVKELADAKKIISKLQENQTKASTSMQTDLQNAKAEVENAKNEMACEWEEKVEDLKRDYKSKLVALEKEHAIQLDTKVLSLQKDNRMALAKQRAKLVKEKKELSKELENIQSITEKRSSKYHKLADRNSVMKRTLEQSRANVKRLTDDNKNIEASLKESSAQ